MFKRFISGAVAGDDGEEGDEDGKLLARAVVGAQGPLLDIVPPHCVVVKAAGLLGTLLLLRETSFAHQQAILMTHLFLVSLMSERNRQRKKPSPTSGIQKHNDFIRAQLPDGEL